MSTPFLTKIYVGTFLFWNLVWSLTESKDVCWPLTIMSMFVIIKTLLKVKFVEETQLGLVVIHQDK